MSTEAKKAEALSSEEMSGVVGGSKTSSNGTPGGGEFLVGKEGKRLSDAEMSGIAGGGNASSSDGTPGGPEFLVGQQDKPHRVPPLIL